MPRADAAGLDAYLFDVSGEWALRSESGRPDVSALRGRHRSRRCATRRDVHDDEHCAPPGRPGNLVIGPVVRPAPAVLGSCVETAPSLSS